MTPSLRSREQLGRRRKEEAHRLLEGRRDAYLRRARRALLEKLLADGRATADDVRDAVSLPKDLNPVCFGAVPGALAKAGIIERADFTNTRRPAAHARPVTVWALRDRAKAQQWLAAHRDRPEPTPAKQLGLFANEETPAVAAAGVSIQSTPAN